MPTTTCCRVSKMPRDEWRSFSKPAARRLYSPTNSEFRAISQLAACDERRPRTDLGLPSYIISQKIAIVPAGLCNPKNKSHLIRKAFPSRNEQNKENTRGFECHIVLSEEFFAANDDNVCTVQIMARKDILELVRSSRNSIETDSDDINEMSYTAPVPTSAQLFIKIK
ncbi:hypothetical protein TNCV_2205141 [Trichonephila clavipes]|nr:hypothetical protein TNCV_2205141 [Trichonephila clavipes]